MNVCMKGERRSTMPFSQILLFLQRINACTSVDSGPGKERKKPLFKVDIFLPLALHKTIAVQMK
jgi:hypothetical protein